MQLCLFSISYAGLWGQSQLPIRQFIHRAAELGFDAVMLAGKRPQLAPVDVDDALLMSICDDLRVAGIACPVVAAYTDLGAKVAAEVPMFEMQLGYVEELARIGAKLGARVVRVFTGYELPEHTPHQLWRTVVAGIREMADRVAGHGLTLAIQNHHDVAVHTDALLELLSDIDRPNCKLGFDAWSPALRGEDVYEAAKRAALFTAITTNADYIRLPRYRYRPEVVNYEAVEPSMVRAVPFGTGVIDYARFFQGLRDGGFNGVASYEICSPIRGGGGLENLDASARRYVAWMTEHGLRS